jgi:hypothetical protein
MTAAFSMSMAALVMLALAQTAFAAPAKGPLKVHPDNPRYFTDGTKSADGSLKAVYLTGAHTWNNLVDMGRADPPEAFNFNAHLDFLERHGHNFIRLWAWDSTVWDTRANGRLGKDFVHHVAPLAWLRTGPGNALDGKPKFDLTKFDPRYFERLRDRVSAANQRGIYVSVMLFEGWGLMHGNKDRASPAGWAWRSHPFHPDNNMNGVKPDGADALSGKVHHLGNAAVNDLQAAYIRKVVDTVNDLDNVLYEVINEGGQKEWDWWVVKTIRDHERSKPKQHPIGITGHGAEKLASMLASPADWISPGRVDGYAEDPPAWDPKHKKVSLLDTDHIWGVGGNADWVWKAFLRGHNPLFMDPYDGSVLGKPGDKSWEPIRRALGQTRRLAERINLAAMSPVKDVASTGYCLVSAGKEYLLYLPKGGKATVDLSAAKGELAMEWFDTANDKTVPAESVTGGGKREFTAPFAGAAVLYLNAQPRKGAAGGPLRVHPDNPRYFTDRSKRADGTLKAVYLTGSHTWPNLIDRGTKDPPPAFDFDWYLRLLEQHDHNFIRLWGRHVTWYHDYGDDRVLHAAPLAWERRGPGNALDGKPKFDLSRFNQQYFDRLRSRATAARDRGIYVSIMLFGGRYECTGGWRGNPFNASNNLNGIDGDPNRDGNGLETHTLDLPAMTRLQEAYVRKVIDTVNDLDNVLYEISNESHTSSVQWQYHLIRYIKDYEKAKSNRHPVGMTALWGDDPKQDNRLLYASQADWVSPQINHEQVMAELPAADGAKVRLLDSDHWFIAAILKNPTFGRDWVWKAFSSGHNPLLMENLPLDSGSEVPVTTNDPGHVASRTAMGHTRRFAQRMNLAAMTPAKELASSSYCLANPGNEYLVYLPKAGGVIVDLSAAQGELAVEWFDPANDKTVAANPISGGARREFKPPFDGGAVLYLKRLDPNTIAR